jgi:hypothetical protein
MRNLLLLLIVFLANSASATQADIDGRCNLLAKKFIEQSKSEFNKDYTLIEVEKFYSHKIDSCILIEKKLVGVEVRIRDLSKSIIRDGGSNFNMLLYCDIDGADSVILDKVSSLRGRVFNVSYSEWLDDGFGGQPRALKTPEKPYTKQDCELVLNKWLSSLK